MLSTIYNGISKIFGISQSLNNISVTMYGIDASGKTTILYVVTDQIGKITQPTVGFNFESFKITRSTDDEVQVSVWDIGRGAIKKYFYERANALIYVIDCNDRYRINESIQEIHQLNNDPLTTDLPLLILANKQDINGALTVFELTQLIRLPDILEKRKCFIQPCSANTTHGVKEGFQWIINIFK